jgi:hypothetical protein
MAIVPHRAGEVRLYFYSSAVVSSYNKIHDEKNNFDD